MDSSLIILDYYIQPARYEKYCINKDKPQMHCNGKCQMIKRIKTEEKRDQDNPERRNKNEITLSARSFFPSIIAPVSEPTVIPKTPLYSGDNIIDRSLDIFHPPQV
ncbi:MAG TPA: hypothetical protein VMU83_12155 [Hanamia sp.]|nr:hypothetical protein [Hanamia sp.]